MAEVASSLPMQMTLVDVARLAKVQRPVVSVWRSRGAASTAPFPEPFATVSGEERFDADAVLKWLELTGRGNNPDVRADCAAFASPKGMSTQDDKIVFDGLAVLLCLKEISGARLASLTDDDLLDLADEADPDDEFLSSRSPEHPSPLRTAILARSSAPTSMSTISPARSKTGLPSRCISSND